MRFSGGRLRFDPQKSHHRSGSHEIEIPARAANSTAGFGLEADPRFPYQKISLLHHVRDRCYNVDITRWHWSSAKVRSTSTDKKQPARAHHLLHDHGYPSDQHHSHLDLDRLEDAVFGEVNGKFAVAKINFFKIYLACVGIITSISKKAHGTDDQGSHCLCFLETMLTAADRYKANEHRAQPFGHKDLVRACEEAMTAVLADRHLDEFLWKGI